MRIPPGYAVQRTAITASSAFSTSAAPQYLTGGAVAMEDVQFGTLSALCTVDAESNTLTITAVWQVSTDGTTYYDVAGASNNAANVALATGTSGSDAAVSKVVPAPDAIYAYPWARVRLMSGVTTADGTNDIGGAVYRYLRAGAYANL
jgi:hypothetical protein